MAEISIQQQDCTHPRLVTLPLMPNQSYGIACISCGKRAVIHYGDYLDGNIHPDGKKEEFCLSVFIENAFGTDWGQEASKQCRCTQCKAHMK